MKLRLRENSIRFRLRQSEITELRERGTISESIKFNQFQTFTYKLKISSAAKDVSAAFENSEIIVEIPTVAARDWTETNLVGLESVQLIDENLSLKITIEKDFVCPDRPLDEGNADAFPNPKTNC